MQAMLPTSEKIGGIPIPVIIVVSMVILGVSGFIAAHAYSAYAAETRPAQAAVQQTQAAVTVAPTKPPQAVLGVATEACPTKVEFADRVVTLRPQMHLSTQTEQQVLSTNKILKCLTISSIAVSEEKCSQYLVSVSEKCLYDVIMENVQFSDAQEIIPGITAQSAYSRINDATVDYSALARQLKTLYEQEITYPQIMNDSVAAHDLSYQVPVRTDEPNTYGIVAKKYIEVDGSRQLMFLWNNGKYKTFRISGAYPEYNPVGVYKIRNKSKLAWSSTANKWMPYWMAFTFDPKQDYAGLGIHSLVYWYEGMKKTGTTKIWESEKNIGTPRSTGCLRLTLKDAEYVFNWANVGDIVVVHD